MYMFTGPGFWKVVNFSIKCYPSMLHNVWYELLVGFNYHCIRHNSVSYLHNSAVLFMQNWPFVITLPFIPVIYSSPVIHPLSVGRVTAC